MANDIDLWNEIIKLERMGKEEQAEELFVVYRALHIESTSAEKQDELKNAYESKYGGI